MRHTKSLLSGLLTGGLVGAALAILMAPASGEELRQRMRSQAERIQADVSQAAANRRAELERQLEELRSPQRSE